MDTRYTDTHVRSHPELRDIATRYTRDYHGEFEPMLAAKALLLTGSELPTAVVRMVLNVMRADPHVSASLPTLVSVPDVFKQSVAQAIASATPKKKRKKSKKQAIVPPQPKPRRVIVSLRARWKAPFIAATMKNATAYHLLNPDRSEIRFHTRDERFEPFIYTWCNQRLSTGVPLMQAPPGRHECRQCRETKVLYEERRAENLRRIEEMKENVA